MIQQDRPATPLWGVALAMALAWAGAPLLAQDAIDPSSTEIPVAVYLTGATDDTGIPDDVAVDDGDVVVDDGPGSVAPEEPVDDGADDVTVEVDPDVVDLPIDFGVAVPVAVDSSGVEVTSIDDGSGAIYGTDGSCINCSTGGVAAVGVVAAPGPAKRDRKDRNPVVARSLPRNTDNLCNYAVFDIGLICDSWRAAQLR